MHAQRCAIVFVEHGFTWIVSRVLLEDFDALLAGASLKRVLVG